MKTLWAMMIGSFVVVRGCIWAVGIVAFVAAIATGLGFDCGYRNLPSRGEAYVR